MQYTIYKLNKKLGKDRWWRNYDSNNIGASDIDIETYLSNKNYKWEPLLNTNGEAISYQTISRDSYDEIELYIKDNIPDYIKIEIGNDNLYYYVKNPATIYNARDTLNYEIRFELDKKATYWFKFHQKFISDNVNMFFVKMHQNRVIRENGKYIFDCNRQTYLLEQANSESKLVLKENKAMSKDDIVNKAIDYNLKVVEIPGRSYTYTDGILKQDAKDTVTCLVKGANELVEQHKELTINDNWFNFNQTIHIDKPIYQYVITKYKLKDSLGDEGQDAHLDSFLVWPITIPRPSYNALEGVWASNNTLPKLYHFIPEVFTADNIIGKFISYIPPSALGLLYAKDICNEYEWIRSTSDLNLSTAFIQVNKDTQFGCIQVNGLPVDLIVDDTLFDNKVKTLLNNFNVNSDYRKIIENNPHLLAPQYLKLSYQPNSATQSAMTTDFIDLSKDYNISFTTFLSSNWYSTLSVDAKAPYKVLSSNNSELIVADSKQAPIECSAWNNTWLQRQALDNTRNAKLTNEGLGLGLSTLSIILGVALAATGYATPLGIGAVLGGIGGLTKSATAIGTGQSQYEQAKKSMYEQAPSLNAPVDISGLSTYNTNNFNGLEFFTLAPSDIDIEIINTNDNMYGYKTQKWLPYSDYLNCWHGNYMLCDVTKNFSTLVSKLKEIDSILTVSDTYIIEFLNALNNGVIWYANGEYRDLGTDEQNWERIFPEPK